MSIKLNDAEFLALAGLSDFQFRLYVAGIRPRMDYASGIAGLDHKISYQSLHEDICVDPVPGTKARGKPSKDQMYRALRALERRGLIQIMSHDRQLVLKVLLANTDQSAQNKAATRPRQRPRQGRDAETPENKPYLEDLESSGRETGIAQAAIHPESGKDISNEISISQRESTPKRKSSKSSQGTRLPDDWALPDELRSWAEHERPDLDIDRIAEIFKDYWLGQPGKDGRKADWKATWRNWVRREKAPTGGNDTRQGQVQHHSKGNLTHDDFNSKDYQSDATRDEDLPEWLRNALH